ncbi:MAG TPA: hypothetical protein DEO59_02330 [Balneola sp.]|nr:hypothetical protein [Balneola sp.]
MVGKTNEELKERLLDLIDILIERQQVDREKQHKFSSKLFKLIALKIHPDKATDEFTRARYEKLFKEAKNALDDFKYIKLIELAKDLRIDIPRFK